MPKFITTVEGHERVEVGIPTSGERYGCPNDVPVPLRHNLKYAHHTGLSVQNLAKIYELPVEWVELFVRDIAGNA